MTTITLFPDDTGSERPAVTTFVSSFNEFCEGIRDGQAIEARYRKLSRMSKSELAEIGLTRADIYRAALLGRPV
jgi:uncharacterized protein YjiS (DUF1127 family)